MARCRCRRGVREGADAVATAARCAPGDFVAAAVADRIDVQKVALVCMERLLDTENQGENQDAHGFSPGRESGLPRIFREPVGRNVVKLLSGKDQKRLREIVTTRRRCCRSRSRALGRTGIRFPRYRRINVPGRLVQNVRASVQCRIRACVRSSSIVSCSASRMPLSQCWPRRVAHAARSCADPAARTRTEPWPRTRIIQRAGLLPRVGSRAGAWSVITCLACRSTRQNQRRAACSIAAIFSWINVTALSGRSITLNSVTRPSAFQRIRSTPLMAMPSSSSSNSSAASCSP